MEHWTTLNCKKKKKKNSCLLDKTTITETTLGWKDSFKRLSLCHPLKFASKIILPETLVTERLYQG